MRPSTRRALLWQVVGMLCYLGGLMVFILVAIGVYMAEPKNSFANLSSAHVPVLVVSTLLILGGRVISHRYGVESGGLTGTMRRRYGEPDKTKLEELGYVIPPEAKNGESGAETGPDGDAEFSFESGEVTVVCQKCGAENDPDFRFCGNCSAELPS